MSRRRGQLWEPAAVPEIRDQAVRIAWSVLAEAPSGAWSRLLTGAGR